MGHIGALLIMIALAVTACGGGSAPKAPAAGSPGASGSAAVSIPPLASGPVSSNPGAAACEAGSITAVGSSALQPLVEQAARDFMSICPGTTVSVQGGGSGTGLSLVSQGGVTIGNSDIEATDRLDPAAAAELVDHQVVKQGFVMVTNGDVQGVSTLTTEQMEGIWTGKIANWKDVGGPDMPIVLILRPLSSGTRATFKKLVLKGAAEAEGQALTEDSNGAVTTAVNTTPGATSVIGFAYYAVTQGLQGVALDGIEANLDNLVDGSYPIWAYGHMYTKGEATGLAKAFLDYMLSDHVQKELAPSLSYAPVK